MSWQKRLRAAIALFVVVFTAFVVVSLRRGHGRGASPPPAVDKKDPGALVQSGKGRVVLYKTGKQTTSIEFGHQATFPDNRSRFTEGVAVVLPDKSGRRVTIRSEAAEITTPPEKDIGTALFTGGVTLTTSDGITLKSDSATYADQDQTARIPGKVAFTRGRMSGTATGATYDQARHIVWLLDAAKVDVAPDRTGGGAVHVTAKAAGMARLDHYMRFTGGARLDGEGHIITTDDAMVFLTPDDEKVQRMELRGSSQILTKPGQAGPQAMRARDIDAMYAPDGRTLQSAHMVENASIQLAGEAGKPSKRIAAKAIDLSMGPDGSTVTNLTANESVQVDLPPDGETPARRIRSSALLATGPASAPPGQNGIQNAAFVGDVEFREWRQARGNLVAIDRTARAQRLDAKTKPGFGDIETAAFHSHVHFTDGPDTVADAPMGVYAITRDTMDLTPNEGDTGKGPTVSNGRIGIEARTIQMTLASQRMKADTNVRSVMTPQSKPAVSPQAAGRGAATPPRPKGNDVRMPSMLKQDKPVNVKSNRLDYDGDKSIAIYDGNAHLWQDDTDIKADKIVLEDKTGNLHATTNVTTRMTLEEAEDRPAAPKPGSARASATPASPSPVPPAVRPSPQKPPQPTVTTADDLVYEDGSHHAVYTGNPHMVGPEGDVTAQKLELFLAEQGGQLERAEADGSVVSKQVNRRAFGSHLTYVARDDTYTMTGVPAKVYDDAAPSCKYTEAATVSFKKAANTTSASGTGGLSQKSQNIACGTVVGGAA